MTGAKENRKIATRRGCLAWMLGVPLIVLAYLFLLSTEAFDSKPVAYPDLETEPEGTVIPFMEALTSCPEWPGWKASEDTRRGLVRELDYALRENEAMDPATMAAARMEIDRGLALIDCLLAKNESFGQPRIEEVGEYSFQGLSDLRDFYYCQRLAILLGKKDAADGKDSPMMDYRALRLLLKTRPLSTNLIGSLVWLTNESIAHSFCLRQIRMLDALSDGTGLRQLLAELEATRPSKDQILTGAFGGELPILRYYIMKCRSRLGRFENETAFFEMGSKAEKVLGDWVVLRTRTNRTVDLAAKRGREMLAQIALPVRDRQYPPEKEERWVDHLSLAPNAGGEFLANMGRSSHLHAIKSNDMGLARHHLIRLLIALALHRVDHSNALPTDLQALVPRYLPEIPRDPFTGEPPIYDADSGKLAFRGMDFVPSAVPFVPEAGDEDRRQITPPGAVGLFAREGLHDPGVDLKVFFPPKSPSAR